MTERQWWSMSEQEWAACSKADQMLQFLRNRGEGRPQEQPSDRKLRLFACACCRLIWDQLEDLRSRAVVETAERFADGAASQGELEDARRLAVQASGDLAHRALPRLGYLQEPAASGAAQICAAAEPWVAVWNALHRSATAGREVRRRLSRAQSGLVRCIFGNPFRSVCLDAAWITSNGGTVKRLAEDVYEHRLLPSGHLDPKRLATLVSALIDVGCTDATLLEHLRGKAVHTRGCWALDHVLNKE